MQTYIDDCYAPGHQAQTDLQSFEDNFAALKSSFSGANAPSNPIAGMWWLDTTAHILKQRNEASNAWLSVWDMANNKPVLANIIVGDIPAAMKDPAAATAGLRTLGTGAQQAAPGNDSRFGTVPDGYVTAVKIATGAVTGIKLPAVTVSDDEKASAPAERINDTTSYVKVKEVRIDRSGTIRLKWNLRAQGPANNAYGKIYRNGGAVGVEKLTSSDTYVAQSDDVAGWSAGDLIQLYLKSNASNYSSIANNFSVCFDDKITASVITN